MTHNLSPRAIAFLQGVKAVGVAQTATWESVVKTAAAHKGRDVRKRVIVEVASGLDYSELPINDGRETGELPWGQWVAFPYVIEHKGNEYARLYPVEGARAVAQYTIDGEPATREQVLDLLTPGERARWESGDVPPAFTVKMNSLTLAAK